MRGIKEFNKKIGSLKNTRKITKTMKMVSASKFKRAWKAQENAREYARHLTQFIGRLAAIKSGQLHPFFKNRLPGKNVLILLFTSDKGLCGAFNNGLIRFLRAWIQEHDHSYEKECLSFCGRRGHTAFRKHAYIKNFYEEAVRKPDFTLAKTIAGEVGKAFLSGEVDEVFIAYNQFHGPLSQVPTMEKILPLDPSSLNPAKDFKNIDYSYEPEPEEIFNNLIPKFLDFKIYYTLLENSAGEHGARMTAMDKASQNTSDLIDRYTLLRNRARQAAITTELIEIISGAEALK
jgi:F-type H+-transporting ATPase subunit gamma